MRHVAFLTHAQINKKSFVNIIDKTIQKNDNTEIIFRLCKSSLLAINKMNTSIDLILTFFLIQFYIRQGFMPNLTTCINCNSKLKDAKFDIYNGELLCMKCGVGKEFLIEHSIIKILSVLTSYHITKINELKVDKKFNKKVNDFLFMYGKIHLSGFTNAKSINIL